MSVANFKSSTLFTRDNLYILRGMNSECVDLIYLDPPFNSKKNWMAPLPIKDDEIIASFKDVWKHTDIDKALHTELEEKEPCLYEIIKGTETSHSKGMQSYLIYMAIRLVEMRRVLKPSGSIFLHCDPTASHYLKIVMDCIFRRNNFSNEIVWRYRRWPAKQKRFQRMHDTIFWYTKEEKNEERVWHQHYEELAPSTKKTFGESEQVADFSSGKRRPSITGRKSKGAPMSDVWNIGIIAPIAKERTGYKTQKPLKLLERIITACSNEGDLILDPFCGCTTSMVAAEKLDRQWVGIDASPYAKFFVKYRMEKELEKNVKINYLKDISGRSDLINEELTDWEHKKKLYQDQEEKCAGCAGHYHNKDLTIDHIIPTAKGGQDTQDNKQLLCFHCNTTKGTGSMETLKHKLRKANILEDHE